MSDGMIFAGGGFAVLAWELAQRRTYQVHGRKAPVSRMYARNHPFVASQEYYAILDHAWEAWNNSVLTQATSRNRSLSSAAI